MIISVVNEFNLTEELAAINREALRENLNDNDVQRMLHSIIRESGFSHWRYSVSITTELLASEEFLFLTRWEARLFAWWHRRAGLGAVVRKRQ